MSVATAHRPQPISSDQMVALMRQLRIHAGIRIESPQPVIESYLQERMGCLGIDHLDDYLALFDDSFNGRAEWLALIDLLTVKETRFFRQPAAFDCVASYLETLLRVGPRPEEISLWSAGCATGQELYSLGMVVEQAIRDQQPWLEWHGIGTDISFQAISEAQRARYHERALRTLPDTQRHHLEAAGPGLWRVSEDIRARTHFFHSNLLHVNSAPFADFNIIFCQNVLIYFEREKQRWIIDQLTHRLRPGGLLILGAGEDVRWTNSEMRRVPCPGVCAYKKTGG